MIDVPTVSVITPTRNRLRLLLETLDSVSAQSFGAWEHLVVEDGSDDGTADAMAQRTALDSRVRYIHRNGGIPGAAACRNLGLRESRGRFVVFLDSDDLLAPDALARRVETMDRNADIDFAVFDSDVFQNTVGDMGREFDVGVGGDDLDRFLALDTPWETTSPIWRKDVLVQLGGWNDRLASWQDIDLHIRALAAPLRYCRFRTVDHHIRWVVSPERISRRKAFDVELIANCEPCAGAWRDALVRGHQLSPQRLRALAGVYFHLGEQLAGLGHLQAALTMWAHARPFVLSRVALLGGDAMLTALRLPSANGRVFRGLLRRWKAVNGLIPALPRPASESMPRSATPAQAAAPGRRVV